MELGLAKGFQARLNKKDRETNTTMLELSHINNLFQCP